MLYFYHIHIINDKNKACSAPEPHDCCGRALMEAHRFASSTSLTCQRYWHNNWQPTRAGSSAHPVPVQSTCGISSFTIQSL